MPFGMKDTFEAEPLPQATPSWGWSNAITQQPKIDNEQELKKLFGIELAKDHLNPFEAALVVFGDNTSVALWVSSNWINDPEVIASRDIYAKTTGLKSKLLDKEQTAAKFLQIAEEKFHGRYTADAKDRLKALELYCKIQGFISENNIDNSNTFINNEMKVILVKPQEKEDNKQIDVTPTPVEPSTPSIAIKLIKTA